MLFTHDSSDFFFFMNLLHLSTHFDFGKQGGSWSRMTWQQQGPVDDGGSSGIGVAVNTMMSLHFESANEPICH